MSFFKKIFGSSSSGKDDENQTSEPLFINYDEDRTTLIFVPNLKDGDSTLVKWFYKLGDVVEKETPICELESERLSFEFQAQNTGKLVWMQPKGANLKPGDELCRIEDTSIISPLPTEDK